MKKWQWVLLWVIVAVLIYQNGAGAGHFVHHAFHSVGAFLSASNHG